MTAPCSSVLVRDDETRDGLPEPERAPRAAPPEPPTRGTRVNVAFRIVRTPRRGSRLRDRHRSCQGGDDRSGISPNESPTTYQFVYRLLTGDGEIVARSESPEHEPVRRSVSGCATGSRRIRHRGPRDSTDQRRGIHGATVTGGETTFFATAPAPPRDWLGLTRAGSTLMASISSNGSSWTALGSTSASLAATIDIGVVVTSVRGSELNRAIVSDGIVRETLRRRFAVRWHSARSTRPGVARDH